MIEGLIARLLATSAVTAIVGSRISPGRRPQAGPLPDITVIEISGAPQYSNDGEDGLHEARVQIDCWATTYSAAKNLAAEVKTSLSAFVGTVGAVTFQYVLVDSEQDLSEGGGNAAEYLYRTSLDFIIWSET